MPPLDVQVAAVTGLSPVPNAPALCLRLHLASETHETQLVASASNVKWNETFAFTTASRGKSLILVLCREVPGGEPQPVATTSVALADHWGAGTKSVSLPLQNGALEIVLQMPEIKSQSPQRQPPAQEPAAVAPPPSAMGQESGAVEPQASAAEQKASAVAPEPSALPQESSSAPSQQVSAGGFGWAPWRGFWGIHWKGGWGAEGSVQQNS